MLITNTRYHKLKMERAKDIASISPSCQNKNGYSADLNFQEFYDNLCVKPLEIPENIEEEAKNKTTVDILSSFSDIKNKNEPPKELNKEELKTDSKVYENPKAVTRKSFNKGVKYLTGQKGYTIDPVKALRFFKEGAKLDHPMSQFNLGYLYLTGTGCEKNTRKGIKWITLAAANGDKRAEYLLIEFSELPNSDMIQQFSFDRHPGDFCASF